MTTRVYRYGLLPPTLGADLVSEQISAAHRYYNALIEIERWRREQVRATMAAHPEIATCDADVSRLTTEIDACVAAVRATRKATRSRSETAEQRAQIAAWRVARRAAYARRKEIRAAALPQLKEALAAHGAAALARSKQARKNCGVYWGCVDRETQILTHGGWKKHDEFHGDEEVATYNLKTNRLEWQKAIGKTETYYEGEMIRISNARLDMLLTPNHRIVYNRRAWRTGIIRTHMKKAEDMPGRQGVITIPQAAMGLEPDDVLNISPALASVLGWTIAEGHYPTNTNAVLISQSERVNPKWCATIRTALRAAGLAWHEHKQRGGMICFYLPARTSGKYIRSIIPSKILTPALTFNLSRKAAKALLLALLCGDGTLGKTSTGKPRWRWIQKNKACVDLFQALAQRLGLSTHATKCRSRADIWTVSVRRQPYSTWQSNTSPISSRVQYSGTVWCPRTPNATWVARRNGTIFITGNSYLLIEQAIDAACKSRTNPHFRRWDGSGSVGVQLQGSLSWADAVGESDTRLRIDLTPSPCGTGKARPRVRMRIGSEGRDPVWAEWPVILHRPVPEGAQITWARVVRERVGAHYRWSLHITLDIPDGWQVETGSTQGTVAIDLGWRQMPEGLRVGYLRDDAGRAEEILLDPGVGQGLAKVDDLRSIRDRHLDELRPWLAGWVHADHEMPTWFREWTDAIGLWKSQARFAALTLSWRGQRFAGDAEAYDRLEDWRKRDKHLWLWEANQRDKSLRRRREQYRILSADLARRYRTLVIERMDLRELQRHEAPESEQHEIPQARLQQRLASPHELRGCLVSAFAARGGRVIEIPAAGTTRTCHACGLREEWDAAVHVRHLCSCGAEWDQDDNACRNLLRLACERSCGPGSPGGVRVNDYGEVRPARQSKWGRLGRHGGTAREAAVSDAIL